MSQILDQNDKSDIRLKHLSHIMDQNNTLYLSIA